MKIKMTRLAGSGDQALEAGQEYEVSEEEAKRLINAHAAEPVKTPEQIAAETEKAEKAAEKKAKKRAALEAELASAHTAHEKKRIQDELDALETESHV